MTTVRPGLPVLYLRSRALPATLAALAAVAVLAAWAAAWLQDRPEFDHTARVPVLALAPLLAAAAIGTGLLSHTEDYSGGLDWTFDDRPFGTAA
ncbi:hypothetical protein ACWEQJ_04170, partial [Streptomyces cyaneofuscatus]